MDTFEIFTGASEDELFMIYNDIIESKKNGLRPKSLDSYVKQVKEICKFEMFSQATKFTIELFYEETAKRYFSEKEAEELILKNYYRPIKKSDGSLDMELLNAKDTNIITKAFV